MCIRHLQPESETYRKKKNKNCCFLFPPQFLFLFFIFIFCSFNATNEVYILWYKLGAIQIVHTRFRGGSGSGKSKSLTNLSYKTACREGRKFLEIDFLCWRTIWMAPNMRMCSLVQFSHFHNFILLNKLEWK